MRRKIEEVVGDKEKAEDVLKEVIIDRIEKDSKDGINIFIDSDEPTIKFNSFDYVEIKKAKHILEKKIDIEVFPGEAHKPIVTLVNQDNFAWGDIEDETDSEDEEPVCEIEKDDREP